MTIKRLLRQFLLLLLCVIFTQLAFSQTKSISGKISDDKGNPVQGATVTVKGSKAGTSTDASGAFKLNVPATAKTLVISSVGFTRQEVAIGSQETIAVSLVSSTQALTDVVVVGYGTRKVKDVTGSIASLSVKDFNKGVISSPEQLFQGRTPGVTVTPASGEPGAAVSINIRGTNTTRASNPLYVVDGVPLQGGGSSAGNSGVDGSTTAKNPLIFMNPNDIESISILKDASSAAIYGSLAANGVIIITTKSGASSRGAFTFGVSTSVANTAKRYDLLNASDFLAGVKKANIDAGTDPQAAAAAVLSIDKGANTNWQDEIFRTGISQNYNLAWGITKKATKLRLSGSYDDQQGIVKSSSLKRLTGRLNFSQNFWKDKIKFEANLTYANVKNQYSPNSNNAGYQGSLIGAAIAFNPSYPVHSSDGLFYDPGDGNRNPAEMIAYFNDKDNINRFLSNLSLSYTIIKGLVYKFTYGYDDSRSLREAYSDPRLKAGAFGGTNSFGPVNLNNAIEGNGRYTPQHYNYNSTLINHIVTYDKTFGQSSVTLLGGFEYQNFHNYYWSNYNWGLSTPVVKATDVFVKSPGSFQNHSPNTGDTSKKETQSYFFRANYSFADKYFLSAIVRVDGSSVFGKNNKYGTFPSFGAKWKIINENFAANTIGKVFSDLALKANYGILGSQLGLPIYGSLGVVQTYGGVDYYVSNYNPNLKWEQTATTDVGVEFGLFGNRLKGSIDYFYKNTKNLIFYNYYLPRSSAPYRWENLNANVINKGVEVALDFQAIKGNTRNSLSWDINYNMTFYKNTVKNLAIPVITGGVNGQGLTGAYAQEIISGQPIFSWNMPVFLGFDGNGDARYANGSASALLGSPNPKFSLGLNNSFSLRGWNLSFFFNSSTGFYIYNNTGNALFLKGSFKTAHNVTYAVANSNEDPINPGSVSSRFLEKGDFLRLSNATLSYTFNIKSKAIHSLAFSVSGQNLWLLTKYTGLDPEVNVDHGLNNVPSKGFDYAAYPPARTFTAGINIGF